MSYGGEVTANELLAALLAGENITIPEINLDSDLFKIPGGTDSEFYKPVTRLTNEDLTERKVGGAGAFDALMDGYRCHLKEEYEKGRITGAEYTKAYIALTEAAMSNGVQYLLGRDQAFWAAVQAQAAAITARVQLEVAKVQYASLQLEALTSRANYALTKLKLSTEDVAYGQGKFTLDQMLPAQKEGQDLQNAGYGLANQIATYNLGTMMPQQLTLLKEQTEAQRAQTLNNRTDGAAVTGVLGKQKDLYTQQITSYQRDAEVKAAKLFTDAWITQKTIDEGLLPPNGFTNASLDPILTTLKSVNNLG